MDADEGHSGQLRSPILSPWVIYGTCMATGKRSCLFLQASVTWSSCTSSLWEGHLLHLSGKRGRKKGSSPNQLNLSQPASGSTTEQQAQGQTVISQAQLQGAAPRMPPGYK